MNLQISAATATLLAALIGVFGALMGLVVERLLRLTGRLRFDASVQSLMLTDVTDKDGYERNVSWEHADETTEAEGVSYVFGIDLFNGKEVPTGLRDIAVVLLRGDGERFTSRPDDLTTGRRTPAIPLTISGFMEYDTRNVLNIPPRQFAHMELSGGFDKEAANVIKTRRWTRIVFEAQRPKRPILGILGSKTYRKTIIEP
jgi:hypothetical protein